MAFAGQWRYLRDLPATGVDVRRHADRLRLIHQLPKNVNHYQIATPRKISFHMKFIR